VDRQENLNLARRILINPTVTDSAGAASNIELDNMVGLLKAKHSDNLQASDINWAIWANDILQKPRHSHEMLANSGPPTTLTHLFRLRTVPA